MVFDDSNFKRLFELSGDAMMVLGRDTFRYCNRATLDIFSCPSVEVFCSKHPSDLSPEYQPCGTPSRELAQRHIDDAFRVGHKRFQWVHRRLSGEEFYADVLLSPAEFQGEKIIQAIVRDISVYKAVQDGLRKEKEQSELAARAKSEFLAVMSHEIRTPIHGILGAQELLLQTELDPEQQQLASLALDSTKRLLNIVNDVLDFSKIDAGRLVVEKISFNPERVLTGIYQLFKVEADNKSLDLVLKTDDSDVQLLGDPHRIEQVLTNLISNAIKFTDPGGRVTVSSRLQNSGVNSVRQWQISVSDTGIGMTEEQQQSAFDVFTQADSSISRSYGGTGLGLAISRALVNLLGGSIDLRSVPNQGSCFEIDLPVLVDPAGAKEQAETPGDLQRDYQQAILVAEDNATNQFIIRKKLARLGLRAIVVENGVEALACYEDSLVNGKSKFAAVLMDIQMPILNGIDATRELRSRGCRLPIFALTADVQSERKQQCLDAGVQAFIGKPFGEEKLIDLFDQYLGDQTAATETASPS